MASGYGAAAPLRVWFRGQDAGAWVCTSHRTLVGEDIPAASHMDMRAQPGPETPAPAFLLLGVVSNLRYTTAAEAERLVANSAGLGRAHATRGVLIPIRKTPAWWALAQDERRFIYEEQSRHTSIGLKHLPAVARRLHHSRDFSEPFDFLTWFEFAPEHEAQFDDLLAELRASLEWSYVEREVELRYTRAAA